MSTRSCPECCNRDMSKTKQWEVWVEDASKEVWAEDGTNTIIECLVCGYTQYEYAFEDVEDMN